RLALEHVDVVGDVELAVGAAREPQLGLARVLGRRVAVLVLVRVLVLRAGVVVLVGLDRVVVLGFVVVGLGGFLLGLLDRVLDVGDVGCLAGPLLARAHGAKGMRFTRAHGRAAGR